MNEALIFMKVLKEIVFHTLKGEDDASHST